ncbi:ALDH1A1 [Cordylochernes scorpioides]|uniref:ALDH1A1 n=1 Tax=Cordylochernes scorpioides TaxID=51811 RepID=A0ABY6LT65_9ARAC|nr:ALDH1A1 [Cordylochernes scorpioides]
MTVEEAARAAHEALFFNQGQACISPSRIFVQDSIHDRFVARSRELASARVIGDPFDPATQHGPQQILKFKTMEEVIQRANQTEYGLAAGVFTRDINKAILYSQAVHAGTIW